MPGPALTPPDGVRRLWLLRHAKTLTDPPPGGGDHERRLAGRGRRDADALGARLGDGGDRLGVPADRLPQLVLTSTAARTVQTVTRVLARMGDPPPVTELDTLYQASPEDVVDQLRLLDDDGAGSVMVVGHNPTAHQLAATMSSPGDRRGRHAVEKHGFPTCALAVFALPIARWHDADVGIGVLEGLFTSPY